jgi:hypothetical protein
VCQVVRAVESAGTETAGATGLAGDVADGADAALAEPAAAARPVRRGEAALPWQVWHSPQAGMHVGGEGAAKGTQLPHDSPENASPSVARG